MCLRLNLLPVNAQISTSQPIVLDYKMEGPVQIFGFSSVLGAGFVPGNINKCSHFLSFPDSEMDEVETFSWVEETDPFNLNTQYRYRRCFNNEKRQSINIHSIDSVLPEYDSLSTRLVYMVPVPERHLT